MLDGINFFISNITILFNKFAVNMETIEIKNDAKFVTNSIFITLNKFIMNSSLALLLLFSEIA